MWFRSRLRQLRVKERKTRTQRTKDDANIRAYRAQRKLRVDVAVREPWSRIRACVRAHVQHEWMIWCVCGCLRVRWWVCG